MDLLQRQRQQSLLATVKDVARQEGSELTNPKLNPLVVKYIGELKEERLKKYEVNYDTHVAELGTN